MHRLTDFFFISQAIGQNKRNGVDKEEKMYVNQIRILCVGIISDLILTNTLHRACTAESVCDN